VIWISARYANHGIALPKPLPLGNPFLLSHNWITQRTLLGEKMFNVVLPDGTVRICKSKAEAYRVIAESKEAYQGYLK
jgi:hypothetical protein